MTLTSAGLSPRTGKFGAMVESGVPVPEVPSRRTNTTSRCTVLLSVEFDAVLFSWSEGYGLAWVDRDDPTSTAKGCADPKKEIAKMIS